MSALRLVAARAVLADEHLDALLVTHPPNIRYLTGLSASAGAFILERNRAVLVVDGRYVTAARTIAGDAIDVTVSTGPLDEAIAGALRNLGGAAVGVEADYLPVARFTRLQTLAAAGPDTWQLVQTSGIVERLRIIKDDGEIRTLREAGRRLSLVGRELRRLIQPGQTELDVAGAIDAAVRSSGFERSAFETIVASGPNAGLPHARPTSRRLQDGDGVVLDFGGVYDGYCVDLTRTIHLGPMSPDFRRLFDAVRMAHGAAVDTVRPGVRPAEIDAAARGVLDRAGLGEAFSHGTGHGLGLEVHEAPRLARESNADPVKAGMVFTIEPGVYVPGVAGVRIEDDVLVVDGGCELLTDVPIEL